MRIKWPWLPLLLSLPLAVGLGSVGCGDSGAKCGNLKVEKGEECDDGTQSDTLLTAGCTSTCTWQEYNPDTTASGDAMFPAVAMNAAGQYVVAWQANGGSGGDGVDVYAAAYNANGAAFMPATRVNESVQFDQTAPSVGIAGDGRFVIAWHTEDAYGGAGAVDNVTLRAFDSSGAPVTGEIQLNTFTDGQQTSASVAVNDSGQLIVAWTSDGQDGDLTGVYATSGSVDGQLVATDPWQVNTEWANLQENPYVGLADDGRFVISWESTGQETS